MKLDPDILHLLNKLQIRIDFFWKGTQYAQRSSIHVPAIGDEVRFNGVVYKIVHRIWFYDGELPRVAISMKKIKRVIK
jgi:hypothetical protein